MTPEDRRRPGAPLRLVPPVLPATAAADAVEGSDVVEDLASIVLPGRRHSVAVGRHWIVDTVAGRGVTGMANQIVELLSSELLANAVLHGPEGGGITVQVGLSSDTVRVSISDRGTGEPVVLNRDPGALTGRGMAIVDALAARWGSTGDATSTTVWFEVDLDEL